MTLILDIPSEIQTRLAAEAARLGIPVEQYALRLLSKGHSEVDAPMTGAELVAYWTRNGLIGTRPDISDSQSHARKLREAAQRYQKM